MKYDPDPTVRQPQSWGMPALLAAMLGLFIFQADLDGFPLGFHGYLSSHGAAITANLSPEHGWLMFERQVQDRATAPVRYLPYNRFPITTFLILKLVSKPFEVEPGTALLLMHQVMNLFLVGAICFAYRFLCALRLSRPAAVVSVLCAFSSFYILYYGDMIFVDTPTLFGCMLALEGIAIHYSTGKRAPLLWRACVGILFGWQVYAFLLPYLAVTAFRDLRSGRSVRALLASPAIHTGLAVLCVGGGLLFANLWNEQRMTKAPWSQLSTLKSAGKRLGAETDWNQTHAGKLGAGAFLKDQLVRIGKSTAPHLAGPWPGNRRAAWTGAVVLLTCILLLFRSSAPLVHCTLLLSGIVWAIPMKHFVAFHEFQGMYYIGIPLALYASAFHWLDRKWPDLMPVALLTSLLLFVGGTVHCARNKALSAGSARSLTEDVRRILPLLPEGATYNCSHYPEELKTPRHGMGFYFPDRIAMLTSPDADYLLDIDPERWGTSLTPGNSRLFLFRNPGKPSPPSGQP